MNHCEVTRRTPELMPSCPNFNIIPTGEHLSLDRFNVHRHSTRRIFSGSRFEDSSAMWYHDKPATSP
ncbi:hypothetical protein TNCV_3737281 [Trichonephila clavipes]|nr:hypothetical protein TNCV_3737281 [Trichonephila clavipes]